MCRGHLDRVKRIWYLSPMRAAKVQASLRIRAVSPEPSLLAHTSSESRGTFRQKTRSLAPLDGWACAVEICHDGMLEDTNSLDGAHLLMETLNKPFLFYQQTLMSEIASTLERRRSHTNSYSSVGRPQSVTFDDDVFLTQDGPVTRNSFHSNRSSVHSNSNRNSFHDIVRSSPMPAHEKVQGYRNNILNNSSRSRGSVSSDGYLFYYGKDKKQLNENELYDLDKNQLYATVNK